MIEVVVGDLAQIRVDAVLRLSTDGLAPVGPVTNRLDAAAGPDFAKHRTTREPLDIGAAIVTGAGDLAAQFVIHAVVHTDLHPTSRATIERALVSAWQRATDWGLCTLAAAPPGVGAGLDPADASTLLIESFTARTTALSDPPTLTIVVEDEAERARIEAGLRTVP
ncbi:MAG TPA: macro domain-containing protein [Gemmatimonadales bacterium]|nr:macro domain-containing protein [Gemmatimonadales bacterium]